MIPCKYFLCRSKLGRIDEQLGKPAVNRAMNVMDVIGNSNRGFKGILTKIRAKKQGLPHIGEKPESEGKPQKPGSPKDVCDLIDHFLTLPKIYPVKPKKAKPRVTSVMMEKYKERKKQREMAMSYGTRTRLKRVDHHSDTLKNVFLTISH